MWITEVGRKFRAAVLRAWCSSMKNQYFGDINDYRKYGLLRVLSAEEKITTAICWMLTPDDDRTDGGLLSYLEDPDRWSHYDPVLYERLQELVLVQKRRDVRTAGIAGILASCRFFPKLLPDDAVGRAGYFETFAALASGRDLIFFDPDNGIEIKSKSYGRKGSSKYIYWRELTASFSRGHSLLIYQHFPRVPRDPFIEAKARELAEKTGAPEVISFRTPRVLFLLARQERHREFFQDRARKVGQMWASQIRVESHPLRASGPTSRCRPGGAQGP